MSIKQFKFVSPGVFVNEIDNSFLPEIPDKVGPVVIGRTERGPAMEPYKVNSFAEFVNVFGNPIPGGSGKDVWRYGNYTSPTYAAYAAQAYLRNSAPVTVVRLLGDANPGATAASGKAGWKTNHAYNSFVGGGAFGLWIAPSSSLQDNITGTLAAVWYMDRGSIYLSGTRADEGDGAAGAAHGQGVAVKSSNSPYGFKAMVYQGPAGVHSANADLATEFNFNPNSSKFIRKVFNTNPTLTNTNIGPSTTTTASYWLGPTYENWLGNPYAGHNVTSSVGSYWGVILPLRNAAESVDESDNQVQMTTKI